MGTCCSTDNDQDPNADNNAKLSDPLLAAQEAADTATGAAALQSAVATGDLSASAQAAMNLAASAAALRWARENARRHGVGARVETLLGSWERFPSGDANEVRRRVRVLNPTVRTHGA